MAGPGHSQPPPMQTPPMASSQAASNPASPPGTCGWTRRRCPFLVGVRALPSVRAQDCDGCRLGLRLPIP